MSSIIVKSLSNEGFLMETVMSDVFFFMFSLIVFIKIVVPKTNDYLAFKNMEAKIGGPKAHWLKGHLNEV